MSHLRPCVKIALPQRLVSFVPVSSVRAGHYGPWRDATVVGTGW